MASRQILAHLDDVGVSFGSVKAWKELRRAAVVRSASVMVPCPWYRAAVEDWHEDPGQDLGVHITLTSEWSAYRWRPLTGAAAGLTDDEGYFHRHPETVARLSDPAAVADEIAAQIERVQADGIRPTHLDAHMGTAFLRPFVDALLDAAARYAIPVTMCRDFSQLIDIVGLPKADMGPVEEIEQELERRGNPIFDSFLIGFCPDGVDVRDHYAAMLSQAGPGFHWLALHANAPDDTARFAPHMVAPRRKEYVFFRDTESRSLFSDNDAVARDWRGLS